MYNCRAHRRIKDADREQKSRSECMGSLPDQCCDTMPQKYRLMQSTPCRFSRCLRLLRAPKGRHRPPLQIRRPLPLWYTQLFQFWYKTYRDTSSLRLADAAGAVRARAGVLWGAVSLAQDAVDAFIERAMAASCSFRGRPAVELLSQGDRSPRCTGERPGFCA